MSGPLVLGHGAVVGAGQDRIGAAGASGLGHHVRRVSPSRPEAPRMAPPKSGRTESTLQKTRPPP